MVPATEGSTRYPPGDSLLSVRDEPLPDVVHHLLLHLRTLEVVQLLLDRHERRLVLLLPLPLAHSTTYPAYPVSTHEYPLTPCHNTRGPVAAVMQSGMAHAYMGARRRYSEVLPQEPERSPHEIAVSVHIQYRAEVLWGTVGTMDPSRGTNEYSRVP